MKHFYIFLVALLIGNFGFSQTTADAWINEIHYDNNGADVDEAVEIVVADISTYPLANWYIQPYNGSNGQQVGGENYFDTPDDQSSVGTFTIASKNFGLQNGTPEAMALIYDDGSPNGIVVQFLSYEGSFSAINGEASGLTSTDIGVQEGSSTAVGESLQLNGTGSQYSDFTWISPATQTRGAINNSQTITTDTFVQFTSTSATVAEDVNTYDLIFSIINANATVAATFDVALTGGTGDNADINSYTTQTVTFAAGSSANETITLTVTDDALIEGDETLTFSIQNVAGGTNATVGTNTAFDLTITDNDGIPDTIAFQSFGTDGGDWNYTTDPVAFIDADTWDVVDASFRTFSSIPSEGTQFFGVNDLNGPSGTPDFGEIQFETIQVDTYESIEVSFDYEVDGYDGGDRVRYELFEDGVSVGIQDLVTGASGGVDQDGTFTLMIGDGVDEISLIVFVKQNGNADYAGFDNFKVTGFLRTPITYTYNGTWTPANPSGISNSNDNISIVSGNANSNADYIGSNTIANNLDISSGAKLVIAQKAGLKINGTFTNDGDLTIRSNSTEYGSLIADNVINNSNLIYRRHTNSYTGSGNNDLISAPFSGESFDVFAQFQQNELNIYANPLDPSVRLFGPFDKSGDGEYLTYDEDVPADAAQILTAGVGYRAATDPASISSSEGILVYKGEMETSTVTLPIVVSGINSPEWNVIGNPYPSYIKLSDFLATNGSEFDTNSAGVYGYDGNVLDGWVIWNQAHSDLYPDTLITPGQGFVVASQVGGGTITFNPSMRSFGATDDFILGRNTNDANNVATNISHLKLNIANTSKSYNTDFYFTPNASQGLDVGYDASVFGDIAPQFAIYSHLVQNNEGIDMAIQSLGENDLANVSIPLGVNANPEEQLTFSIAETTLPSTIEVYLDDTVSNTTTLLNSGDYTLTPNVPLNDTGRFYLRVTDEALSTPQNALDNLSIYTNHSDKTIVITGQLLETATANIYDLQGRIVITSIIETTYGSKTIDVSNISTGVYVVQLVNATQQKTHKVIIR